MVAVTVTVCAAAVIFRVPLRSRYWAWHIVHGDDPAERLVFVTALCNAGEAGRWGTSALLDDESAEIRQLGTVVLQSMRTDWAAERLLHALADPDEGVRELAALGLAVHGDNSVVPTLKQMYSSGDQATATAACTALERLGTAEALAGLGELVHEPTDAQRRAALVDALAALGEPACVPPLIALLTDHRTCGVPPRTARLAHRVLADLTQSGRVDAGASLSQTQPAEQTIAERAAVALARITGTSPPFSSKLPAEAQRQAVLEWRAWHADAIAPATRGP